MEQQILQKSSSGILTYDGRGKPVRSSAMNQKQFIFLLYSLQEMKKSTK